MQYQGLAALCVGLAVVMVIAAIKLGWKLEWLLGWLKGLLLFVLLALGGVLAIAAWELKQFKAIDTDVPVAILEFQELAPQRFNVLVTVEGVTREVIIAGDLWEMDAQVLRWTGLLAALGLEDGYRLNRFSGRFLALEQQRGVHGSGATHLHETPAWRDMWVWLDRRHDPMLVEADAFTIGFMPLVDGARFAIDISVTGLNPAPLNPIAANAV
jgi:hypothetical protein